MDGKKAKKTFEMALVLALVLSGCESKSPEMEYISETDSEKNARTDVTMALLFLNEYPYDLERIKEELNKITEQQIDVHVEIIGITSSKMKAELNELQNKDITFDISTNMLPVTFLPIDPWIQEVCPTLYETFTSAELATGQKNGIQYTLPVKADTATCGCLCIRKDLLEKYNISLPETGSWNDVDEILSEIADENIALISPYSTEMTFFSKYPEWDILSCGTFALMDNGQSEQVEILYETEEYRQRVQLFYQWRQKGYLPEEMQMDEIAASVLVKSGELASYSCPYKPGIEVQESNRCGCEMAVMRLSEPLITNYTLPWQWGITEECSNPEAAARLLNLLYTDPAAMNLLNYGIEGIHYVVNEEGQAAYPEDADRENTGYDTNIGWELPNQYLCYVWEGNEPDLWEKTEEFNRCAQKSKGLGFSFTEGEYASACREIERIAEKYSAALERGWANPEIILPAMLEELKAAGAEEVQRAIQQQLEQYWEEMER